LSHAGAWLSRPSGQRMKEWRRKSRQESGAVIPSGQRGGEGGEGD
jgi:hypothetical protein